MCCGLKPQNDYLINYTQNHHTPTIINEDEFKSNQPHTFRFSRINKPIEYIIVPKGAPLVKFGLTNDSGSDKIVFGRTRKKRAAKNPRRKFLAKKLTHKK